MPTGALHSHFWQQERADEPPEPPVTPGASVSGGYVPWQTTVLFGSLFGALQTLYERMVKQ